jgi:hypothetical protein
VEYNDSLEAYNNGNPLNFLNDDGSMDVMMSTNFFRHIVPEEFQTSFGAMRAWLLEKNLIGENAPAISMGYRIPTQGISSTFALRVADVVPSVSGDTIIVPDGFTSMTGSDFDVDKIYIMMMSTDEQGNLLQMPTDGSSPTDAQLTTELIRDYLLIISDDSNLTETRASIDTLTGILKKKVLPVVQPKANTEAPAGYALNPSF